MEPGYEKGDICRRNGCVGIIDLHQTDNSCSCHISPPCSYCTTPREYCPECDWQAIDEKKEKRFHENSRHTSPGSAITFNQRTIADLDKTKIDWIVEGHTHFSMIKRGVYPEGTTQKEVENKVIGTFGGRFEYFNDGQFKYIAYTD